MKKYILTFILSVMGLCIANAQEPVQGIIVTYEGAETSYKLEDVPTVMHKTVEGVQYAVLYLKNQTEPVLSLPLAEGKALLVTYGEYVPPTPTTVEGVAGKVTITEKDGKKIINGGKLIIIGKDGKMYNAAGDLLKQ